MLTSNEKKWLDEVRERESKATQGPWQLQDGCSWRRFGTIGGDGDIVRPTNHWQDKHPDLDGKYENFRFIEHSRSDVPRLLAIISRLDAENEKYRAALERYGKHDEECFDSYGRLCQCRCGLDSAIATTESGEKELKQ